MDEVIDWCRANGIELIRRWGWVNIKNSIEVFVPSSGESVGLLYPDGFYKLHCFFPYSINNMESDIRCSSIDAVARNFMFLNPTKGKFLSAYLEKMGEALQVWGVDFKRIASGVLLIKDYDIDIPVAHYTWRKGLSAKDKAEAFRKYNGYISKNKSFVNTCSSIEIQKVSNDFITRRSTSEVSKEYDMYVSEKTVGALWGFFKEDVDRYNSAYFGFSDYPQKRSEDVRGVIRKSIEAGNVRKIDVHRDTGLSRVTIDKFWESG